MRTLTRKGYGRIYVERATDIPAVKAIIAEMDESEIAYLPADLIAEFSEYPKIVYTHKFCDLDMNALQAICWSRGIHVWVLDAGFGEWITDAITAHAKREKPP